MDFNLRDQTIFLTVSGSRSYGTELEDSDWDYRGICIPPLTTYFGLDRFEQVVDKEEKVIWKSYPEVQPQADMQVLELSKFIEILARILTGLSREMNCYFLLPFHMYILSSLQ